MMIGVSEIEPTHTPLAELERAQPHGHGPLIVLPLLGFTHCVITKGAACSQSIAYGDCAWTLLTQREATRWWVMRQMVPLPSSVTRSDPSCAATNPTGRPQTCLSEITMPVMKSSYSPVGLPVPSKGRRTTL